jgi:hypothetical protein
MAETDKVLRAQRKMGPREYTILGLAGAGAALLITVAVMVAVVMERSSRSDRPPARLVAATPEQIAASSALAQQRADAQRVLEEQARQATAKATVLITDVLGLTKAGVRRKLGLGGSVIDERTDFYGDRSETISYVGDEQRVGKVSITGGPFADPERKEIVAGGVTYSVFAASGNRELVGESDAYVAERDRLIAEQADKSAREAREDFAANYEKMVRKNNVAARAKAVGPKEDRLLIKWIGCGEEAILTLENTEGFYDGLRALGFTRVECSNGYDVSRADL